MQQTDSIRHVKQLKKYGNRGKNPGTVESDSLIRSQLPYGIWKPAGPLIDVAKATYQLRNLLRTAPLVPGKPRMCEKI